MKFGVEWKRIEDRQEVGERNDAKVRRSMGIKK